LTVLTCTSDEDGDDHAVHAEDTSHDDGDDRSEEKFGLQDSDGDDTDARLSGTVSGTKVGEDEGSDNTHASEKGSLVGVSEIYVAKGNIRRTDCFNLLCTAVYMSGSTVVIVMLFF